MTHQHVAVIDIGKTNAKLALVRLADLAEIAVITRPNTVLPGPPYPHFDVEGHWHFVLDGLAQFHAEHGVCAITVTTHGASGALIAQDGSLAAPILDYEHTGPNEVAEAYDAIRPPFDQTGSPRLSLGLNLGAQFHWQFERDPSLHSSVAHVVTYPQFWAHRLTGVLASDITSLGCHGDLWDPYARTFSSLPKALGIADKIAPPRKPSDVLGAILPSIAARTGLPADTPVYCGIHDSNASLLSHLIMQKPPFSVVSTGTWVIAMAVGSKPVTLDPDQDASINVNAFGDAVPSSRFMGGREYDIGVGRTPTEPSRDDLLNVLRDQIMLMPALVPETGPFVGAHSAWLVAEPPVGSGQRSAAVAFYLALVTAHCLVLIGHQGRVVVEGPFARNQPFLWMLAEAAASPVVAVDSATGTSQGAALLVSLQAHKTQPPPAIEPPDPQIRTCLSSYASQWRARVCKRGQHAASR